MEKKIIAVVGATGLQGTGVVNALIKDGSFKVRAITRNPDNFKGKAAEVVKGDLTDLESLSNAFTGAHGAFVVTNFWESADEMAQGTAAVDEIVKNAGFAHYSFVQAPLYYQNCTGQMAPQKQHDGSVGWTLPINPAKKVIHMADISDLDKVVAAAQIEMAKEISTGEFRSLDEWIKQRIEALLRQYEQSLNNSDAELAQSLYTKDGIFMPTEAP